MKIGPLQIFSTCVYLTIGALLVAVNRNGLIVYWMTVRTNSIGNVHVPSWGFSLQPSFRRYERLTQTAANITARYLSFGPFVYFRLAY